MRSVHQTIRRLRKERKKTLREVAAAICVPLTTYAAALTRFADGYAIGQMERHLGAFPGVVKLIETTPAQPDLKPV